MTPQLRLSHLVVRVGLLLFIAAPAHAQQLPANEMPRVLLQESFETFGAPWTATGTGTVAVEAFSLADGFEQLAPEWTLEGSASLISTTVLEGQRALAMGRPGARAAEPAARPAQSAPHRLMLPMIAAPPQALAGQLTRALPHTTDVRVQIAFFDYGQAPLKTYVSVAGAADLRVCGGLRPQTSLGVDTSVHGDAYVIRMGCAGAREEAWPVPATEYQPSAAPTLVPRRIGWHVFELTVTSQGTFARIDERELTQSNPSQTSLEQVGLALVRGADTLAIYDHLTIGRAFEGGGALALRSSPRAVGPTQVSADLAPSSPLLVRAFYFDTLEHRLDARLQIADRATGTTTAIGTAGGTYVLYHNGQSSRLDTGIRRVAGWHMVEFITTADGTFVKVDNHLLHQLNARQRVVTQVTLSSQGGTSYIDGLRVARPDARPWQEQLYTPLELHYRAYGAPVLPNDRLSFEALYHRDAPAEPQPQLGYCALGYPYPQPRSCPIGSNDVRSINASIIAWYLYGQKIDDAAVRARALRAFEEMWPHMPWKRQGQSIDDWTKGATLRMVAYAAYVLRDELPTALRQEVTRDLYIQARTYRNRIPESGYRGDTKAEENAWHAAFLAAMINLFPEGAGEDRDWMEGKARCFAYHAITRSSDPPYCGMASQTVYDDWTLENHYMDSPTYMSGTLTLLGEAAMTYRMAGKDAPPEFAHNVAPLYQKYMTYVDTQTYHYVNVPLDWDGAHNSAFISPVVFCYAQSLGLEPALSWQDLLMKRSLFYDGTISAWIRKAPETIRVREWNQIDRTEDSFQFFLSSVAAGEFYALTILWLSLDQSSAQPTCAPPAAVAPYAVPRPRLWYS